MIHMPTNKPNSNECTPLIPTNDIENKQNNKQTTSHPSNMHNNYTLFLTGGGSHSCIFMRLRKRRRGT